VWDSDSGGLVCSLGVLLLSEPEPGRDGGRADVHLLSCDPRLGVFLRAEDGFSLLQSRVQLMKGVGLLLQLVTKSTLTLMRERFGSC